MRLENEFEVDADIERAWLLLTDLEQVMPCIPGASLDDRDGDSYRGHVKIKVGPIQANLQGAAHFESCDDTAHDAVIRAAGKDSKGSASVDTSIHARLEQLTAQQTRVVLDTDLDISGRMAQFGRGAIADVGTRILNQFAANIGQKLAAEKDAPSGATAAPTNGAATQAAPTTPATTGATASHAATADASDEAGTEMKMLDLIGPMIKERYGQAVVGALAGLALGWLLFGRGKAGGRARQTYPWFLTPPPVYWEHWNRAEHP
jgi:carbon monoxide dehydrogenase subunit G